MRGAVRRVTRPDLVGYAVVVENNTCGMVMQWGERRMLHKTHEMTKVGKKGAKPLIVVRNETFGGSSQIL